ncbi:MAG TPA: ATP-binding protein, partial [Candidatus Angelobacter sp.]|nr:ATP-binding protein [Candidatus Angelobacter sp.]
FSFVCASARFLITQNRQEVAATELRSSRDLLEAVVEGTTEAIYVRDLEGRYLFANRAARGFLVGAANTDVLGRCNQDFFSEQTAKRTYQSDVEVARSGKPKTYEEAIEIGEATHVFLTTKAPYRSARGKVSGVLGIAVDVTERRKMEEELRKAQRMESIGTLAGGVAHDFNNLLTVIKGYSQLLIDEMAGTPAQDKLRQIDHAAEKAATLTRQLLAFSRQQVLQPKVVNLNHIICDMEKILRRLIGEDIDFSVQLASDLKSILADPGQLEQVIMNLAANSRDAMPRGGKFAIQTANVAVDGDQHSGEGFSVAPGAYILFAVSDTGVGMDQATQARIFEPFFTTKPPGKGTGLGLSTVYGITKQSGGYIFATSAPDQGTTFKMYFPAVDGAAQQTAVEEKNHQPEQGHETILVVEDEATLSKLVETSLKKKGYRVLVASSCQDAEFIAQQHDGPIHLLLTDVVMPQTSGREVAQRICHLRPQTRVLWMSGYTDDTIVRHGMLEPGIHFLQKPFTPSALADKVRQVLDKN